VSTPHVLWYPGHELLVSEIVRAENCRLQDAQGRTYVDLESGVWCTSIGHGHPRLLQVLTEQSARVAHTGFNYSSGIVGEAAREVLSLPGLDGGRCVFLCSGSEAIEYGVRVAQSLLDRPLLMTMSDSYFGAYGSASRREEDEWYSFDWQECAGCAHSGEGEESCEHWSAIPFDRIGGFLLEPGSSSGLVRFPPERLVRSIVHRVKKDGGLVLVNEVTTGIGRTGEWFGHQHYGFTPDVVALGKGIGNGYPVSVAAFGREVARRFEGRPVQYAQSHQNDPLGAALAREVLRVIRDEGLIERGRETGELLSSGLVAIQARAPRIREVRGRGLMVAVELDDDPQSSFTRRTHRELVRRGYMLARRPGLNVLRLDPALTIDRADIEGFLETLEDVLGSGSDERSQ
jgi:acetylornithine aminotransferase